MSNRWSGGADLTLTLCMWKCKVRKQVNDVHYFPWKFVQQAEFSCVWWKHGKDYHIDRSVLFNRGLLALFSVRPPRDVLFYCLILLVLLHVSGTICHYMTYTSLPHHLYTISEEEAEAIFILSQHPILISCSIQLWFCSRPSSLSLNTIR